MLAYSKGDDFFKGEGAMSHVCVKSCQTSLRQGDKPNTYIHTYIYIYPLVN